MHQELDIELYQKIKKEEGKEPVILDLGCGPNKFKYAIGVDLFTYEGVDLVADLEHFPYPFSNNVFNLIFMNHVIEHLANVPKTMEEIYRILRPNGRLVVRTPYFANEASFRDPTHRHHLTLNSMDYFVMGLKDEKYRAFFEKEQERLFFQRGVFFLPGKVVLSFSKTKYEKYFCRLFPGYEIFWVLKAVK